MLSRKQIAVLLSTLCLSKACTPAAEPKTTGTITLTVMPSVGWTYYDYDAENPDASMPLGGGQSDNSNDVLLTIQDNVEMAVYHTLQENNIVVNTKSITNTFEPKMADGNKPLVCVEQDSITDIVSCTPDAGTDGAEMSGEITVELETALPEAEFAILLQGVVDDLLEHKRFEIFSAVDVVFTYDP